MPPPIIEEDELIMDDEEEPIISIEFCALLPVRSPIVVFRFVHSTAAF